MSIVQVAPLFEADFQHVELAKAYDNPIKFYGKISAGMYGTAIFQKQSSEAIEVNISDDIPLSKTEVSARGETFVVTARLYDARNSEVIIDRTATFDVKKGTQTLPMPGESVSLNVTINFVPY